MTNYRKLVLKSYVFLFQWHNKTCYVFDIDITLIDLKSYENILVYNISYKT